MTDFVKKFEESVEKNAAAMAAMSDDFAAHPEVSGTEKRTSAKLIEVLKAHGFDVTAPYKDIPYSFTALKGKKGGPKACIMVEYDALPEIGHACGHNLHGSMAVLAACALAPIVEETGGELLVAGTPAEETNGAKVAMAENGLFDDCAFAMMIHSSCGESIAAYRSLALSPWEFTFTGKTSHAAAAPWEGLNALNGLQLFFHAIDMLRQHVRPEVRMHGIVSYGGAAPNIVPERAVGQFYFRAPQNDYLETVVEKVFNCARGAALATGTEVTWRRFELPFKDMTPNETAEKMAAELMESEGFKVSPCEGFMGSSDVGDVTYHCPAIQPELDISAGKVFQAHTRDFAAATLTDAAHDAMRRGARIIGKSVIRVLTEPELREQMRADFEKNRRKNKK
ncbi:amidohydrolase [Cloacibacillus evryensis]|uniref:amidohydrolase n=1 Tax=Cloacibacillus evryensis TaxID=508460 RepID=UPI00241C0A63|nr:amidohydrolase [Cloacibacillus evryensis]